MSTHLSFNGAARFCVRKCSHPSSTRGGRSGFNGAARFCVRKSRFLLIFQGTSCRFNGAARFCVRKSTARGRRSRAVELLQWGRTFLRAEIGKEDDSVTVGGRASMGPHVFACGNGI